MEILVGTAATLGQEVWQSLARYRYRVFVERLGWPLDCRKDREVDQFDRSDTWYVALRGAEGAIEGIARLLPTQRPYLLAEVFPELLGGMPAPHAADVWELSRFAAVDLNTSGSASRSQLSSRAAIGLLQASISFASASGVKRLITVSPVGVERLLRKAGFTASRASDPVDVGPDSLFACWIDIPQN